MIYNIMVEDLDQAKIVIDNEYGMKASKQDFIKYQFPLIIKYNNNKKRGVYWTIIKENYNNNSYITFEEWSDNK